MYFRRRFTCCVFGGKKSDLKSSGLLMLQVEFGFSVLPDRFF